MVSESFTKNMESTYSRLRTGLAKNPRGYDWRISQLKALRALLEENDKLISEAMWKDLKKSPFECEATEQGIVLSEINFTIKKLKQWMKPRRVKTPLYNQFGSSHIVQEPFGLTLIIGAWNYPINLLLAPLVGAIAGGNGAILKPSEISAETAHLIAKLVPKYLDQDHFAVIEGAAEETDLLLNYKFDLIFFTGSGPVGKIILSKAAVHLTPTILELGGKSPAIIWKDADLDVTARRIAWGKFMNAGQTCIAPDYLLVHPAIFQKFSDLLSKTIRDFYGSDPSQSPDYCRIVNLRNFDRLKKLAEGVKLVSGGKADRDKLYMEPTLLETDGKSPIMLEEIFGPLLPMLKMDDEAEICAFIRERPKPLSLYIFSKDKSFIDLVVNSTSSGAVCINDNVIHMPVASLPFGGVGDSGMGNYHGRFSFDTFTHAKGVLKRIFCLMFLFAILLITLTKPPGLNGL